MKDYFPGKMELRELFNELIAKQEEKLLSSATSLIANITSDDILQPNDYVELENHPYFRYEEGVLKGLQTAEMAFLAWLKDQENLEPLDLEAGS